MLAFCFRWFLCIALGCVVATLVLVATYPRPRVRLALPRDRHWDGFVFEYSEESLEGLRTAARPPWLRLSNFIPEAFVRDTLYHQEDVFLNLETGQISPTIVRKRCREIGDARPASSVELFAHVTVNGAREAENVVVEQLDFTTMELKTMLHVPGQHYEWSTDGSRIVIIRQHETKPLQIDVYDLPSVSRVCQLNFPDRIGIVARQDDVCAALEVALSPDGKRLALAEGWKGLERSTPLGIEVWDTSTGALVQRITDYGPACGKFDTLKYTRSRDVGATNLRFDSADRLQFCVRHRHKEQSEQYYSWLAGSELFHFVDVNTGLRLANVKSEQDRFTGDIGKPYIINRTPDKQLELWLHGFPRWELKRLTVKTPVGVVVSDEYELPEEICSSEIDNIDAGIVPEARGTCLYTPGYQQHPQAWQEWLSLRFPEMTRGFSWNAEVHRWTFFDWKTRKLSTIRDVSYQKYAKSTLLPDAVAMLIVEPITRGDEFPPATLEVWSLPPRAMQTEWAFFAGMLTTLLVGMRHIFIRRRSRQPMIK